MRRVSFPEAVSLAQDGAVWITPSAWLAAALRRRFDEFQTASSRVVWPSSRILPWRSYLQELWLQALELPGAPLLLTPAQELAIWEQVIRRSSSAVANLRPVARDCRSARRLMLEWQLSFLPAEWASTPDTENYNVWQSKYASVLRRRNWIDLDGAAVEMRAANLRYAPAFVFAGHGILPPEQAAWIELFRKAGSPTLELNPSACASAKLERRVSKGAREEWMAAARWAFRKRSEGARSVAIVNPDPNAASRSFEDALQAIWDEHGEPSGFSISTPRSLAMQPAVATALQLLDLACGGLRVAEASSLLRSPFLGGAETERSARARLDAGLRAAGPLEVNLDRIEKLLTRYECEAFARRLERVRRISIPSRQSAANWARTVTQILNVFGWPGERGLSPAEAAAVKAWSSMLSDFVRLDLVEETMSVETALRNLRQLAAESAPGPPVSAAVEIVTPEEAVALNYDAVRVVGVHDGVWPPAPKWHPLLPLAAQIRHGIPGASPEAQRQRAVELTRKLIALAPEVIFTRALSGVEGSMLRATRLLGEFAETPDPDGAIAAAPDASWEIVPDHAGPPPVATEVQKGGTRLFQLQSACPFQAFAALRLGARALETGEPGLDPRDRGSLLHKALEHLWSGLRDHATLMALHPAELEARAQAAAAASLAHLEHQRRAVLDPAFRRLEHERVAALLLDWLKLEQERRPFRVESLETERYIHLAGMRIRVKLDRIDRVEGVGSVLIDYKTGSVNTKSWEGERPQEPQVPLYALTQPEDLAGAFFACLKREELGFRGIGAIPGLAPEAEVCNDLAAKLREWGKVLQALAEQFSRGDAPVDPRDAEACKRCDLSALCRIRDRHD